MGNLYRFMLLLHIACAILGFGAVAFNGMYRARARQRGGAMEAVLLEENSSVSRIAEFLIYGVFVFGILVALTSKVAGKFVWEFKQSWLSVAMVLYLVDIGLLHGFIHRGERQYSALLGTVNGAGGGSGDVAQLEQLEQRISLGWVAFDVVFLVILYLMVFKPGL
jgi:uncharacterized membrane protein